MNFRFLNRYIANYKLFGLYTLWKRSYLKDLGWFESWKTKESINIEGEPIPWITYSSLTFLKGRINKKLVIFEYGSGNSTLWFANHALRVISCEHDKIWSEKIRLLSPKNAKINYVPIENGRYAEHIKNYSENFDIIFVDGVDRTNCIKTSLSKLSPNGVMIVDDSDRKDYEPAFEFILNEGYKRIDFEGMGPIINISWQTTIFYRNGNCLGI